MTATATAAAAAARSKSKLADLDKYPWRVLVILLDGTEFSIVVASEEAGLAKVADILQGGYASETGEDVGPRTEGGEPERSNWYWYYPLHQIKRLEVQKRTH